MLRRRSRRGWVERRAGDARLGARGTRERPGGERHAVERRQVGLGAGAEDARAAGAEGDAGEGAGERAEVAGRRGRELAGHTVAPPLGGAGLDVGGAGGGAGGALGAAGLHADRREGREVAAEREVGHQLALGGLALHATTGAAKAGGAHGTR
jgi:hypothetical protein